METQPLIHKICVGQPRGKCPCRYLALLEHHRPIFGEAALASVPEPHPICTAWSAHKLDTAGSRLSDSSVARLLIPQACHHRLGSAARSCSVPSHSCPEQALHSRRSLTHHSKKLTHSEHIAMRDHSHRICRLFGNLSVHCAMSFLNTKTIICFIRTFLTMSNVHLMDRCPPGNSVTDVAIRMARSILTHGRGRGIPAETILPVSHSTWQPPDFNEGRCCSNKTTAV